MSGEQALPETMRQAPQLVYESRQVRMHSGTGQKPMEFALQLGDGFAAIPPRAHSAESPVGIAERAATSAAPTASAATP